MTLTSSSLQDKVSTASQVTQPKEEKNAEEPGKGAGINEDREKHALYNTSIHEDTVASICERMDALLAEHIDD